MFVLLLLFQHVFAIDTSRNAYVLENIDACPDIGYYFKRQSNPNAIEQLCHLCFCQDNGTTVCWPRDSRRCDKKHYYHLGKKKRVSRLRRSPSFSDIFFRDAARDIFNKQMPSEQCKPHESSYSEGCPPADWCIGCTVCDCDANGRWDCHVLSFCPDDKGKKQVKKRKGAQRNKIAKRQLSTKMPIRTTTKKPTQKPPMKNINKKQVSKQLKQNKKQINTKNNKIIENQRKKTAMNKAPPQKKNITARRHMNLNRKNIRQVNKANKAKNTNTKISETKTINTTDATAVFAENILKKVMASVERFLNESQKNIKKSNATVVQKRSISKQVKTNTKDSKNLENSRSKSKSVNKVNKKQWMKNVLANKQKEKLGINFRRKREVIMNENFENIRREDNRTIAESKLQDGKSITNKFVLENTTIDNLDKINNFRYAVNSTNTTTETNLPTTGSSKSVNNVNEINRNTETYNSVSLVYKEIRTTTSTENTQNNTKIIDKFKAKLVDISFKNMTQTFIEIDVNNNKSCGKVCEFRKTLHNFFLNFRKKNSTVPNKRKKINILGHMKIFINKIFQITKIKGKKSTNNDRYPFRKRNFIRTMCKNFSSCNYNFTDKVLHSKLNQLKVESSRIIKSVKIIKGLLKLLSSNESNGKNKQNSENLFNNNDERILTSILKDEHEAFLLNLTETQRLQIRYIKENTLIFIKSVENLANLLNDLVDYVTNRKNIKTIKLSRPYHRYLRKKPNMININETVSQKLDRLKKLLVHYNLVHNKFIKQMYDVISTLESTRNTTNVRKKPKVSYKNENKNNTLAIDNYVKNIIKNLRKLKDLAQKLSSKSRRKRSATGDDDGIEYLLTLMEFILKQSSPLDVSSVKDGIDLIIEAIKSSPDIKPNKNKIFDFSDTTEDITNFISQENYLYNITQIPAPKFKTFKSIDDEDTNLMVHNISNDEKHYPIFLEENRILTTQPHNIIYDDIDLKVNTKDKKGKSENKGKQVFEIFFDDDEDDTTVEDISKTKSFETEASTTTEPLKTVSTKTQISLDKKSEELKTNRKTRLDWIDEAFSNENQQIIETTTDKVIKSTRTIKQNGDKYENGVSSVSEENVEKNGNLKANSDEVYKRQMNLFNTLDYGTEKSVLDSVSREEKYNVETFPLYFA